MKVARGNPDALAWAILRWHHSHCGSCNLWSTGQRIGYCGTGWRLHMAWLAMRGVITFHAP